MLPSSFHRAALRVLVAAALVSLALVPFACRESPPPPVVLIGVDGLDWRVVLDLQREGRMPVLSRLMEEGTFGYLKTLKHTVSPVIWTTVATGKGPKEHGIRGFTKGGSGPVQLFSNRDRTTKALWNIFSDAGHTVHSVGWWMTFPAEPIQGVMVAQTNTGGQIRPGGAPRPWKGTIVRGLDGQVTPREWQGEVIDTAVEVDESLPALTREVFGELPPSQSPANTWAWDQSLWSFRADMTYLRVTSTILAGGEPPALLMVYFGSPDVAGHRYWRHAYPEEFDSPPGEEEVAALGSILADTYGWVDSAIGVLLESYAAAEPTVFIVSDHGMRAAHRRRTDWEEPGGFSGGHTRSEPGVLIASGGLARRTPVAPSGVSLEPGDLPALGSVYDITPTILALAGLAVGEDMGGAILKDVLREGVLDRVPLRTVASHDTAEWLESRPQEMLSAEAEKERLDQLRSLGYIE
jgi:hypothetical protein